MREHIEYNEKSVYTQYEFYKDCKEAVSVEDVYNSLNNVIDDIFKTAPPRVNIPFSHHFHIVIVIEYYRVSFHFFQ